MPDTADKWPPDILFHFMYASAVLHYFAPQSMLDSIRKQWRSTFYPRGITSTAQASHQATTDRQATEIERKNEQDRARDERAARRANRTSRANDNHNDYVDYLMMMPYILSMLPDELEALWRKAAEERAERVEWSHLEDKDRGWAREVANTCQDRKSTRLNSSHRP